MEKIEKANKGNGDNPEPLTPAQKQKMIAQSQMANNTPGKTLSNPFSSAKK